MSRFRHNLRVKAPLGIVLGVCAGVLTNLATDDGTVAAVGALVAVVGVWVSVELVLPNPPSGPRASQRAVGGTIEESSIDTEGNGEATQVAGRGGLISDSHITIRKD